MFLKMLFPHKKIKYEHRTQKYEKKSLLRIEISSKSIAHLVNLNDSERQEQLSTI